MTTPPKLSFACPLPWTKMSGTERSRFCAQCGHHVRNLSLMSDAERAELQQLARTERICGTYYVRLSGEMVTPDAPLTRTERSRMRQFGVATLSAGALALATGCVTSPNQQTSPVSPPSMAVVRQTSESVTESPGLAPRRTPEGASAAVASPRFESEAEVIQLAGVFLTIPDRRAPPMLTAQKRHPAK